jgi:hypothetical protein
MALVGRLYHVGIVVPDIEVAQAHLGELLGTTATCWACASSWSTWP